jgi:glutamine amidotransferase
VQKERDWEIIGKNQYLLAGPDGTFEVADVPYGFGWDATD